MKRMLIVGLVVVLVLGLGMFSFAHYNNQRMAFGLNQGFGPGMMHGGYAIDQALVDSLSELTGLTKEEINQSGLPLHVIAEENDVLDEFLEVSLNNRIESINALVENGSITEAYGELRISQMTEMHEYMLSEDYESNGFHINRKGAFRGAGFCHSR